MRELAIVNPISSVLYFKSFITDKIQIHLKNKNLLCNTLLPKIYAFNLHRLAFGHLGSAT